MRLRQDRGQEWCQGGPFASLVLAAALGLALPALTAAEPLSLGEAQVADAPQFSYEVAEVAFEEPLNISTGAEATRRLELVKVVVRGEGFRPRATGPVVWLNGIPTLRTQVAEDGASVEAYFLESLQELENAADRLGRWELVYQPYEGANKVYRISPTGDPAEANNRPPIRQLSPAQRQRLEALRQQFGIR